MKPGPDLGKLYETMVRMRAVEEALARLWRQGLISGEIHLGIGEEAVIAGVLDHLRPTDALALDYRPTPALVGKGVDLRSIILEVLGHPAGLGGGRGGHMHLFDRSRLAMSTGIVGSPAPLACGLAMAAGRLRPGSVAVGFFGDGAVNQGMVMESWNLAVAWGLPVAFVVKDNQWAATTRTARLTGGSIAGRARSFGLRSAVVDGTDVTAVWRNAASLVGAARKGRPGVLVARVRRPSGHMLDDTLSRTVRHPIEMLRMTAETFDAEGGGHGLRGLLDLGATVGRAFLDEWLPHHDPLKSVEGRLGGKAAEIARRARGEIDDAVTEALVAAGVES